MRRKILNRATELKFIPTLSKIIAKVFTVLSNQESSFSDLSEVIQHDQAISSKVISIANSAYYSRGIEICTLQRALIDIGFEEATRILVCILFMENMLKHLKLKEEDLFALWKHSLYVACASKVLSEKTLSEDPREVYTAGLFHDIGKVVFYTEAENYGKMVNEVYLPGKSIIQREREAFGIDHQETGYVISVKWKFPPVFTQVIRHHHEGAEGMQPQSMQKLIWAADRFSASPNSVSDIEDFILQKEKETIAKDMKNIMDMLRLG